MRISDWSSDVCSSDLFADGYYNTFMARAEPEPALRPASARRFSAPASSFAAARAGQGPTRCRSARAGRSGPFVRRREDRKSDVEGKSVAVRGESGGGRIITKKTKPNDNTRSTN